MGEVAAAKAVLSSATAFVTEANNVLTRLEYLNNLIDDSASLRVSLIDARDDLVEIKKLYGDALKLINAPIEAHLKLERKIRACLRPCEKIDVILMEIRTPSWKISKLNKARAEQANLAQHREELDRAIRSLSVEMQKISEARSQWQYKKTWGSIVQ